MQARNDETRREVAGVFTGGSRGQREGEVGAAACRDRRRPGGIRALDRDVGRAEVHVPLSGSVEVRDVQPAVQTLWKEDGTQARLSVFCPSIRCDWPPQAVVGVGGGTCNTGGVPLCLGGRTQLALQTGNRSAPGE